MKGYRTVGKPSETELEIKKSRFIGRCFPVGTEEEALAILAKIKKQHWDARHNCFAYIIGPRGECARYSDDGEPAGTAGMPIMEVLRQADVTNVLCVVTRYFGGVLLGTGGLVRAYTGAASGSLKMAERIEMCACVEYAFDTPYAMWGTLENLLRTSAEMGDVGFGERVSVQCFVREEESEAFEKTITERFDAKLHPERVGMAMRAWKEK